MGETKTKTQVKRRGRPPKVKTEVAPVINTTEEDLSVKNAAEESQKLTASKQKLADYYDSVIYVAKNKFGISPDEGKQRCIMCKTDKQHSAFFRSYSIADLGSINSKGERHLPVCKSCTRKIYNYLEDQYGRDMPKIFNHWCQILNLYYSNEVFEAAMNFHNGRKGTGMAEKFDIITDYITALGRSGHIDATYWDSPYLQDNIKNDIEIDPSVYLTDQQMSKDYPPEFERWNNEDLDDYDSVVARCKYDPFLDEETEDRRKLYHSFVGFSDEDIGEDSGKMNACIDMCRSILRLEKLNRRRAKMEKDDSVSVKDLKQMAELQASERKSIQQYQKDWGFNRKFDINKSHGSGTLTGIMKQLDDGMYEDALINAYDIKTSNAMQSAANASWKAIFEQLNLSDGEFQKIISEQRDTITKLRGELLDVKESLRLANIELKRHELEEQAESAKVNALNGG